jgi:putative membrane protein
MKHLRVIVVILFVLLVIIIAVQNYEAMSTTVNFRVNLVFFNYETAPMSIYFVVVIAFLIGVIVTGLYGMTERFRLKRKIKTLTKEANEKDKELNSLRNLPVTTDDVGGEKTSGGNEPSF